MGSFIFKGLPYFSDDQGIIWTVNEEKLQYVTELPMFFSVPMDLPHTFINNRDELIFCSYDQLKGFIVLNFLTLIRYLRLRIQ